MGSHTSGTIYQTVRLVSWEENGAVSYHNHSWRGPYLEVIRFEETSRLGEVTWLMYLF